ncbi:predicted protein [Sclerotinia sclerotiorum 1980 UF-70]|uniref:Uncharacterized protein n=1 Tax=Sclerotinia sclerotiorum (strain ATCC 18683 / 1980 / Ss-1) TaxID=665079 RepID=A7EZF2_SCLS1|nr:predicted protein [Sclerotinia sclerotiorum 1980 UF-70]EDN94844.1 predicted protein [Sclerotinia sclerotiorum 1980 UF-70]
MSRPTRLMLTMSPRAIKTLEIDHFENSFIFAEIEPLPDDIDVIQWCTVLKSLNTPSCRNGFSIEKITTTQRPYYKVGTKSTLSNRKCHFGWLILVQE